MAVHGKVLARAAEILGGKAQLRAWLHVSAKELDTWLDGSSRPPTYIFLKAVDLISAESDGELPEAVRRSRELRRQSDLVNAAARDVRDRAGNVHRRAAESIERAVRLRAALLTGRPAEAQRRKLSAEDFAATEYSLSEPDRIVEGALNAAVSSTAAQRANLQIACREGLRIVAHLGFEREFLDYFAVVHHDTGTCGRARQLGQRVVVTNVLASPLFAGTAACGVMERAHALACTSTPLVARSGETIGMLNTHYEEPTDPSPRELASLDLVAAKTAYWLEGGAA